MEFRIAAGRAKSLLSASILTAVFGSFLAASGASAVTLKEAVQETVKSNPEIGEASANRKAVDQELRQAKGLYYPSVDLAAGAGWEWTDTVTIDKEDLGRTESSIIVTETLFDGGFRSSEVDRQKNRVDSAAYRVRERSEAIALDAVRSYLDTLRNQEIVKLARENVERHKSTLAEIKDRVKAGQSGVGDEQQASARLSAAQATLVETLRTLDESQITYARVVGSRPSDLQLPIFEEGILPKNVEDIVAIALDNNPDIKFASSDIKTSAAEIKGARASYYPTINLEVGASADDNIDGVRGHNDDFLAMLRMRYNLYRGGIDVGREKEAIARKSESEQKKMRYQRLVEEETRRSWSTLARSEARAAVLSDQVVSNGQVASTYRQEFEIGQRDLLDLLDADNELFNSRTSLVTVEYSVLFAKYRLLATMGRLTTALGVILPEEARPGDKAG